MKLGEKGFTLIELLMVIAIVALIANAAAMSTFQVLRNTESNRNKMTAVNQVQNAGYWISLDAQRAQTVLAESAGATTANVSWEQSEYGTLEPDDVLYFAFSGDGGSNWGSNIEAFSGDDPPSPFNYTIPQQYLTADFKMRFLVDFSSSDEYACVDNIDISPGIFSDDCSNFANWNNGIKWSAVSGEFRGKGGGEASWHEGWQYRKEIAIDPTKVEADLFDFPVLIKLPSDYDLAYYAQDDGDDILFTNAGGTFKLSHEIEYFDGGNGELVAWVKVSSLSSSTDTILYMYYGNATVGDQQDAAGVWDSNYKGVWHLDEDPSGTAPQMKDSTSNNDGTAEASMTSDDQVAGQVCGSIDFDGTDDYVDSGLLGNSITNVTFSTWFKSDDAGSIGNDYVAQRFVSQPRTSANSRFALGINDNSIAVYWYDGSHKVQEGTTTLTAGSWYYGAVTYDGSTVKVYLNGIGEGSWSGASMTAPSSDTIQIGRSPGTARYFDGILDEVRISATDRSAEWIKTSYNNQSVPSNFYSLGPEEEQGSSSSSDRYLTMSTSLDLSSYAVAEGFPLTFEWTTWDESGGTGHQVTYSLTDGKLIRSHSIGDPPTETQTYIAQYIDPANTSCNFTNGKLTFTVTATVGSGPSGISESRQFRVLTRPD